MFDDARHGHARLYARPVEIVRADRLDEVGPALERLRAGLGAGRHAAGYLAYEAGDAFEPTLAAGHRQGAGPLAWFGLFDGYERVEPERWLPAAGSGHAGRPRPRWTEEEYAAAAGRVREHLFAGDFYQANLTFGCDVALFGSPLSLYAGLRSAAHAAWGGILAREDGDLLLSLSPEQFFTIRGRTIEARPMKGTAPLSQPPEALSGDPKQRAENLMIVDLLRNDLARVAVAGSVAVPELFAVETYPTLRQMVSRVTATLRDGVDAVEVLRTIFPCGSVTGAPKVAAIRALRELEPSPRGAYTGSMGWIEPGGDASFNVLIRTLERRNGQKLATLGLGSGLVVDSQASDEWAECLAKGAFVTRPNPPVDLIETMRFDPQIGIVELDRHLDRLSKAAEALDFRFDRHAVRNELQAATFGRKVVSLARLLLSPTGQMAVEVRTLPEPERDPVAVAVKPLPIPTDDWRLQYKTTARDFYEEARASDAFETIFTDPEGRVTEGSFTSVFVEKEGRLLTPPLARGVLPGVLRASLVDSGRATEADLRPEDLRDGFFVGNIVRGLVPARLAPPA
ncbi:aminodeoxychorismate synthase, component I [Sphingomonas ginkgonis]|uniref:Probable branched-chain-amino-acid aminotransferase n=1 Tax=Sphingomonas ginkgonis TaxID=2315330 RepID=A0A3R9X9P4_9SPHN|nr:aminodeoxychorismate synthase, component I [Sphingomonas ginkgonis]